MPELPEVETVRRGLSPVMTGQIIVDADVRRPDLRWPLPTDLQARLTGARVLSLRRRAKYLLIDLAGQATLIIHLGMSGRMRIELPEPAAMTADGTVAAFHHSHSHLSAHDHVVLQMLGGARIVFNDARRFGAMDLCQTPALDTHRWLATLGPEPLSSDFDGRTLLSSLRDRKTPIKAALLDQRIVAGLGNIYVTEALWRSGISPRRLAGNVGRARCGQLAEAVKTVLEEAIDAGGSSLRDHRQTNGELGYFQHRFAAYGRDGAPCPACATEIRRVVQAGRSSFLCPRCQR